MVVGTAREYNDLQGEHGVANISLSLELQVCSTCPTPTESDESPTMTTSTTDASPTTLLETQHSGTTSNVTSAIVGGDTTASPDDGTPIYNTDTTGEVPTSRDGMINMRTCRDGIR